MKYPCPIRGRGGLWWAANYQEFEFIVGCLVRGECLHQLRQYRDKNFAAWKVRRP